MYMYIYVYLSIYLSIYIYTHTYIQTQWNISHKKNEILLFAAVWMDLEHIMLSKINQRKTGTYITL